MTALFSPSLTLRAFTYSNPVGCEAFVLEGDATTIPISSIEMSPAVRKRLAPNRRQQPAKQLKILHFNDLHGRLFQQVGPKNQPVFSRLVGYYRQLQTQQAAGQAFGLLFLSAGDDMAGSVFDTLLENEQKPQHASYRLFSAAGLQAGVLGNHDLDLGIHVLARILEEEAGFPLLSANLVADAPLAGKYFPAAIVLTGGIRVGIIGLTTPERAPQKGYSGYGITSPLDAVYNLLPVLQPLCDVIVILSHLGVEPSAGFGDRQLARQLPPGTAHVIIGGHSHTVLNVDGLEPQNVINDIPITQAGGYGRYLGEVTVAVERRPYATDARLLETERLPTASDFEKQEMEPLLRQITPYLQQPIGPQSIAQVDFGNERVWNHFEGHESALANFVADRLNDRLRLQGYPIDCVAVDRSIVQRGVPLGGTVAVGDWFNVMPYADTLLVLSLTGEQLQAVLDDNARRLCRSGEPHLKRGFLHFSHQLRYRLELGRTRAEARACDVLVGERPLKQFLNHRFLLGVPSYVRGLAAPWERTLKRHSEWTLIDLKKFPSTHTGLFVRREFLQALGGVSHVPTRDGRLLIQEAAPVLSWHQLPAWSSS